MKKGIYVVFQYSISFMALLCIFVVLTNFLCSSSYILKSIMAIVDIFITTAIILLFVRSNH